MSSFPLANSYFSRWLKPPTSKHSALISTSPMYLDGTSPSMPISLEIAMVFQIQPLEATTNWRSRDVGVRFIKHVWAPWVCFTARLNSRFLQHKSPLTQLAEWLLAHDGSDGIPWRSCLVGKTPRDRKNMAVCQNLVPLVNIKIAGKWMFIPLKMVSIGIDPYPYQFIRRSNPRPWVSQGFIHFSWWNSQFFLTELTSRCHFLKAGFQLRELRTSARIRSENYTIWWFVT